MMVRTERNAQAVVRLDSAGAFSLHADSSGGARTKSQTLVAAGEHQEISPRGGNTSAAR
jgi:hypothetical protein